MKILWFTNTPSGATATLNKNIHSGGWLQSLEKELAQHDNLELHVAFYWGEIINTFKINNVSYYPIYRRQSKSKAAKFLYRVLAKKLNDEGELKYLITLVDEIAPDIIHIHGSEENYGLLAEYFQEKCILSIQGLLNPILCKLFSGIPQSILRKYEAINNKLTMNSEKQKVRFLKLHAEREIIIFRKIKHCIGRTNWDFLISRVLSPDSDYFNCNEILREDFYTNYWNKNKFGKEVNIVTVMTDKYYKGIETILSTAHILKTLTSARIKWHIIGLNEKSRTLNVASKWLKYKVDDLNIVLYGIKDSKFIVQKLLDSDIYCQVSHIENSSNSLCEAMLLGIPIVATFAGGTSSLLDDGKEGILVQEGEPYILAGAIINMVKNQTRAINCGQAARERAIVRHDKSIISTNMISIYKTVASKITTSGK